MALRSSAEKRDRRLPQTLEVIRGNIMKYGNPLGLKGSEIAGWAKDLDLPREGSILLYTGGEYQLVPYIDGLVDMLTLMDQGSLGFSLMLGVRNLIDKLGVNPEKIVASVRSKDRERYQDISRKAAAVLSMLGYNNICYLGEEELYSGALLYEYGFAGDLLLHARKVAALIRSTGAKTIICLSPHAAEVFKLVYPRLLGDFPYQVKTFVEAVYEALREGRHIGPFAFSGTVTVHDSCRLARELGVTEEIREVLAGFAGVTLVEPELNRRFTTCCGGPGKVLFPELSQKIALRRVEELAATGAGLVLTFCPYCLAALDKARREDRADLRIEDFIEFIYRGMVR